MTTHLAALQAKADQATATREAAEMELLACMRAIEPTFDGTVAGMQDRHWESKLEGLRPFWELARAHSALSPSRDRRAQGSVSRAPRQVRRRASPPTGSSPAAAQEGKEANDLR
jgi:hypothetical protein